MIKKKYLPPGTLLHFGLFTGPRIEVFGPENTNNISSDSFPLLLLDNPCAWSHTLSDCNTVSGKNGEYTINFTYPAALHPVEAAYMIEYAYDELVALPLLLSALFASLALKNGIKTKLEKSENQSINNLAKTISCISLSNTKNLVSEAIKREENVVPMIKSVLHQKHQINSLQESASVGHCTDIALITIRASASLWNLDSTSQKYTRSLLISKYGDSDWGKHLKVLGKLAALHYILTPKLTVRLGQLEIELPDITKSIPSLLWSQYASLFIQAHTESNLNALMPDQKLPAIMQRPNKKGDWPSTTLIDSTTNTLLARSAEKINEPVQRLDFDIPKFISLARQVKNISLVTIGISDLLVLAKMPDRSSVLFEWTPKSSLPKYPAYVSPLLGQALKLILAAVWRDLTRAGSLAFPKRRNEDGYYWGSAADIHALSKQTPFILSRHYIRKLGNNQSTSRRAHAMAGKMGIFIPEGYTFVRSQLAEAVPGKLASPPYKITARGLATLAVLFREK